MDKKIYFTPWEGVDASTEISLFEYGYIMRRQRGTSMWQVMHLVTTSLSEDGSPRYQLDWFDPEEFIADAAAGKSPWFRPASLAGFCGYASQEDMVRGWCASGTRCFDDLQSYWGFGEVFGGDCHHGWYTEAEVRKRLGRAIH